MIELKISGVFRRVIVSYKLLYAAVTVLFSSEVTIFLENDDADRKT